MYIYLDDSIESLDLRKSDNLKSLGYLLDAFSEGYFILSAKRKILKKLAECSGLSIPSREAALFAYKNYATNQSFYNKIPFKIIITCNLTDIDNLANKWIIDLSKIKPGFLSNGILILAENLSDSTFLNFAAEHFQLKHKSELISMKISNHFQGGGGDTIKGELKNKLDIMQEFIFCFKDSDKFSPDCEISDNALACRNLIKQNSWLAFFAHTNCREAENLIPDKLLEKTPNIPYSQLNSLRDLSMEYNNDFYSYIDIKQGLTKKFHNNLIKNSPNELFWTPVIESLKERQIIKECEFNEKKICNVHKQLKGNNCALLEAGNEHTLDHVVNFLKTESLHKSFEIIKHDATSKEWFEIGETVFWLSCALPKIRLS